MRANTRLVGAIAVHFALCRSEFEPPRWQICWPEEMQFIWVLKKSHLLHAKAYRPKVSLVSQELRCCFVQWSRSSRYFLDLHEKVFLPYESSIFRYISIDSALFLSCLIWCVDWLQISTSAS